MHTVLLSVGVVLGASLVAEMAKNPSAMQETQEDLEKGMTTHCSLLAWRVLWTEEPGGL